MCISEAVCCRYGFVESATTADAQAAFNKNRNLYLEGARIEVSMYPKVPANLEEDKHSEIC